MRDDVALSLIRPNGCGFVTSPSPARRPRRGRRTTRITRHNHATHQAPRCANGRITHRSGWEGVLRGGQLPAVLPPDQLTSLCHEWSYRAATNRPSFQPGVPPGGRRTTDSQRTRRTPRHACAHATNDQDGRASSAEGRCPQSFLLTKARRMGDGAHRPVRGARVRWCGCLTYPAP